MRWWAGITLFFPLFLVSAFAHDMTDPDAAWYRSLTVPGTNGASCCSGANIIGNDVDCRNVETRQVRDPDGSVHLEAFASSKLFPQSERSSSYGFAPDKWVRVPDAAIIHGKSNPTGKPMGCWYDKHWRCFVEGIQT